MHFGKLPVKVGAHGGKAYNGLRPDRRKPGEPGFVLFLRLSNAQLQVANIRVREGENAEPRLGAEEERSSGSSPRLLPHSRSYSSNKANTMPPCMESNKRLKNNKI
jgi:hypothetical protein